MQHRSQRLVRGWLGALTATSLAAASHAAADGILPPAALLVLILALSGAVCTALAGRGLSSPRTAAAVLISQGLYHLLFGLGVHAHTAPSTLGTNPGPPALLGAGTALGTPHAAHDAAQATVLLAGTSDPGTVQDSPWMLLAHTAAALLSVAVIRHGELAARRLFDAVVLVVPVRILNWRHGPAARPVARPALLQVPGLPDLGVPLRALRHRGPPACPAL